MLWSSLGELVFKQVFYGMRRFHCGEVVDEGNRDWNDRTGEDCVLRGVRVSRSDREGVIRRGLPELAESFVDIIVTVDAYAMISILEQPRDKTRGHEGCSRCSRMGRRSIPAVTLPCLRKNPCIR